MTLQPSAEPYVLLACTFEAGQAARFALHLYSDQPVALRPIAANEIARNLGRLRGGGGAGGTGGEGGGGAWLEDAAATPQPRLVTGDGGLSTSEVAALRRRVTGVAARCARDGVKYVDEEFRAAASSLGGGLGDGGDGGDGRAGGTPAAAVHGWSRGAELAEASGTGRPAALWTNAWALGGYEIGALADAPLLCAANIVAGDPELMARLFVLGEDKAASLLQEAGVCAVQLYVDGAWRAYVLDDQLPMRRDPATGHASLAFGRGCDAADLWLPLLEKAVAKSLGGYHLLPAIGVVEALGLLAGAVGEEIHLAPPSGPPAEVESWRVALWEKLVAWLSEGRTIGARRVAQGGGGGGGVGGGGGGGDGDGDGDGGVGLEAQGLVSGRGYAVLCVGSLQGERLLRLRCPNDVEFTGDWSDLSDKWTVRTRQMLNYPKSSADAKDGFFWIGFGDFLAHFNTLVCATAQRPDTPTAQQVFQHQWGGACAGGGPLFQTWRCNPQFLLAPQGQPGGGGVRLQVSLVQSGDGAAGLVGGASAAPHAIGMYVLRANRGPHARMRKLRFTEDDIVARVPPRHERQISLEIALPAPAEGEGEGEGEGEVVVPFAHAPSAARPSASSQRAMLLVVPFTHAPCTEAAFTLSIGSSDLDEATGAPRLALCEHVQPALDWHHVRAAGAWAGGSAGGPRAQQGGRMGAAGSSWVTNPAYLLTIYGTQPQPSQPHAAAALELLQPPQPQPQSLTSRSSTRVVTMRVFLELPPELVAAEAARRAAAHAQDGALPPCLLPQVQLAVFRVRPGAAPPSSRGGVAAWAEQMGTDLGLLLHDDLCEVVLEAAAKSMDDGGLTRQLELKVPVGEDETLVLVPCTSAPNVHAPFHLSAYADMPLDMRACGATVSDGALRAENSQLRSDIVRLEQKLRGRKGGSSVCSIL